MREEDNRREENRRAEKGRGQENRSGVKRREKILNEIKVCSSVLWKKEHVTDILCHVTYLPSVRQ